MNSAEYHAHPALGSTGIRELLRSPAHFKAMSSREPTPAMKLGTLVHTLVLEPEQFDARHIVAPVCNRRTTEGKATWAEFVAAAEGREVIDTDTLEEARAMAASLRAHPVGRQIHGAEVERTIMWDDHVTGVPCKARPDVLPASGIVLDVKTTTDASPEGFARSILNFGYHIQAAHYVEGVKSLGVEVRGFVLAVVETKPPYAAAGYVLGEASLALGAAKRAQALDIYAECVSSGKWPGYSGGKVTEIDLPEWHLKREAWT